MQIILGGAEGGSSSAGRNQDFRLTLTSGTPVTISDVAAATTIYFAPYKGNSISLYNGSWSDITSAEVSLALGTLTSGKNYDVFAYSNDGVLTLEALAWTDDTTRATALTYQDGIPVKSGATDRRYVGTFRTISTTQTCDTERQRFLWNYNNRMRRKMKAVDTTDSWNYSLASFRQANASALNQVEVVIGVADTPIDIQALSRVGTSTATPRAVATGIGINSATVNSADIYVHASTTNTITGMPQARLSHVALGYTYYPHLEYGAGADTQTWYGDGGGSITQTGMLGTCFS